MLIKLENGYYINIYYSSNNPFEEECDSVCGFNLFDENYVYEDGGEFDYDSNKIKTDDELVKALTMWYFNDDLKYSFISKTNGCSYEDFDELLEENEIVL